MRGLSRALLENLGTQGIDTLNDALFVAGVLYGLALMWALLAAWNLFGVNPVHMAAIMTALVLVHRRDAIAYWIRTYRDAREYQSDTR